jgi:hypothetical protein
VCVCGGERKWCDENRRPAAISADRPQPRPLSRPRPPLPPSHPNARRSGDKRRTRPCRGGRERATRGAAPGFAVARQRRLAVRPTLALSLPPGPSARTPRAHQKPTPLNIEGRVLGGGGGGLGAGRGGGGGQGAARGKRNASPHPPAPPPPSLCLPLVGVGHVGAVCRAREVRGLPFFDGKKRKKCLE